MQSAEFAMCAGVLLHLAFERARERRWLFAVGAGRSGSCVSRRHLFHHHQSDDAGHHSGAGARLRIVAIWLERIVRRGGGRARYGRDAVGDLALFARNAWPVLSTQTEAFENKNQITSTGERIVFWTKSLRFIASAPLVRARHRLDHRFIPAFGGRAQPACAEKSPPIRITRPSPSASSSASWACGAMGDVDRAVADVPGGRTGGVDRPCDRDRRISSARCSIRSCSISPRAGSMSSASASPPA